MSRGSFRRPALRIVVRTALALGLALARSSDPASADDDTPAQEPAAIARDGDVAKATPESSPPAADARVPKTRFSVRKQIESVEPASWLRRFGRVLIRPRDP